MPTRVFAISRYSSEREHDAHAGHEQPVDRIRQRVGQRDRPVEDRRHRDAVDVVADHEAAQLLEHEDEPVGQQHLLQVVALVEVREQRPLEEDAQHHREHDADDDGDEQAAGQRRQRERHVRADHVEAAMGEIDDAHDAEDQREPAGDEEQQQPVLDAVQELDQERVEVHRSGRRATGRRCRPGVERLGTRACRDVGGARPRAPWPRTADARPARDAQAELAAARRVGQALDRHADELVLLALDLAQVDVLDRVVRPWTAPAVRAGCRSWRSPSPSRSRRACRGRP